MKALYPWSKYFLVQHIELSYLLKNLTRKYTKNTTRNGWKVLLSGEKYVIGYCKIYRRTPFKNVCTIKDKLKRFYMAMDFLHGFKIIR